METFGEWLREQRSLRRLTREELAKRVGCSTSLLRKIEVGERHPSAQIAGLIANCLDIPEGERSTFMRVARGELRVDRLLPQGAPPAADHPAPKINLPVFPTPLIGREPEVEQLCQLLRDPQCRLLTLVGPGGIGKTRLAVEVASLIQDSFADGVYFVPLASVGSIDAAIATAANSAHFAFHGPSDPRLQLLNHLRDKQLLLIADNLEHLLAGRAGQDSIEEPLAEVLHQAAHVKLLVTSREPLQLQDEWVFEVQGLPVPEGKSMEEALPHPSIELFLQRARRTYVGFNPAIDDYPSIARICRLVDGNPLGIELAAARVRVLSCDEIAREIEQGLDFLSIAARDLPARHRSMRAVFDHSWKFLTEEEQRVLARLAVFHGGFSREAAGQVAGATLQVLSALTTKSLVRRSGPGRYDLHELIRQFAASKLAEAPQEMRAAQDHHCLHYLELLEKQGIRLQTYQQKEAIAALSADMDNIRAAWDGSVASQEFIRLYQVSARLMYFFEVRNWFKEGEATFRKTAEALQAGLEGSDADTAHQIARHAMLAHWGFFLFRLGKGQQAYKVLSSSAAHLRQSEGALAATYSLFYLGIACWILGRFSEAVESLQASRALARRSGEHWHEAMSAEFLGRVAIELGEYDQARQYLGEALAMLRRLGDPSMTAHTLTYLGRTLQSLGGFREAEKLLRESLELSRENGYAFATGLALDGLGRLAHGEGHLEDAQQSFSESASLFRQIGETHRLSRTLNHRGLNSIALGDIAGARNDFCSALNLAFAGGWVPTTLYALAGLAALQARPEAAENTLEMVCHILQNPASAQEAKDLAAKVRLELGSRFSAEQIGAAEARAAARPLDEFVQEALAAEW